MQITNRGIILLLLTALFLVTATWLPLMQWVALAYLLIAGLLIAFDWRTAESIQKRFDIRRAHDDKLSLGVDNAIRLHIRNRSSRPVTF